MNLRHRLCALLMLALWLPYYAHCIEPHCHLAIPGPDCGDRQLAEDHGCDHHGSDDHHHDHESPWGECHQHDPASPAQSALKLQSPPVMDLVAQWFAIVFVRPPLPVPILPPDGIASGTAPPLQTFLVKTALPVRGPSA